MNSPQPQPGISEWLISASKKLKSCGIDSNRLDAEIILAHTLQKSRTYLHAHSDDQLSMQVCQIADARLQLRIGRTPIAYIIGHKEFYGRSFVVNPSTLIPRPESEDIITMLLNDSRKRFKNLTAQPITIVDVGTGSGCLGITAKLELPSAHVTLIDSSIHALKVAETNAQLLNAEVILQDANLLTRYCRRADYILANLPYVDVKWEVSAETRCEPSDSLYATDGGLRLIYELLETTLSHLTHNGVVLIEADLRQHNLIVQYAAGCGLSCTQKCGLILLFEPAH